MIDKVHVINAVKLEIYFKLLLCRIKKKLRREDSPEGEKSEAVEATAETEENEEEKEKMKEEEKPAYLSILDEEKRAKDEKMLGSLIKFKDID